MVLQVIRETRTMRRRNKLVESFASKQRRRRKRRRKRKRKLRRRRRYHSIYLSVLTFRPIRRKLQVVLLQQLPQLPNQSQNLLQREPTKRAQLNPKTTKAPKKLLPEGTHQIPTPTI